jgi:hypothetical protein
MTALIIRKSRPRSQVDPSVHGSFLRGVVRAVPLQPGKTLAAQNQNVLNSLKKR